MKNRRIIRLLLSGIALLGAVNAVVFMWDGREKAVVPGMTTLLEPSRDVTAFRIERRGAPAALLARSAVWRLAEPYSSEVDEQVVLRFIDALSQTLIADSISDSELLRLGRTRADFDLENPPLRIKVFFGGKNAEYRFGSVTPSGDGVYAAVGGVGSVFVMPSNLMAAVDVQVDRFRRRSLFSAVPEAVSGFTVKKPSGGMVNFSREGENWKVDGDAAAVGKVRGFLSAVLSSSAVDFVWPTGLTNESNTASAALLSTYGLDPETAVTVTLTGVDGGSERISFGKAASEGNVYALVQHGGAIVTVDAGLKEQAMQGARMFTDDRLFQFEASAVSAFALAEGDVSYSFSRGKNGEWLMETPVLAPADSERVDSVLDRLLALSPADAARSGLEVSFSSNAAPVSVSRDAVLGGLRIEDLRSKDILKIDPVTVKRIVMSTSDKNVKPVSVVYNRDLRSWNIELSEDGCEVKDDGVASVLSAINPLRAERIERLKVSAADLSTYGLELPRLTVAVDQDVEKSVRRNIMLGERIGAGCYATVGSSGAVFVISDETAGKISASIISKDE